MDKQFHIMG